MDGVTYDEARLWTYVLQVFTPSMLADSMGVTVESVQGFLLGLMFNGTIEDTGDRLNGAGYGHEPVYAFVPLPRGPREHVTFAPEWVTTPGCGSLAPRRGFPVRIRSEREMRTIMSTAGNRGKHVRREKQYLKMQEKIAERDAKRDAKRAARRARGLKDWE